ncbi:hypothetical protein [Streptomyces sp. NBC_01012]|uniref:hypothetical protein n=1 Tax=Streptomyces sp. NBC_01012 TaxID=2903717 RepID=UPI00386CFF79|nr:hypothetical protein OG623_04010 [Streptomyces sp. NBC_01012]
MIGSTGSRDKVASPTEMLGIDADFDRRDGPITDRLREAAREGIDVDLDSVGGEQLRDTRRHHRREAAPRRRKGAGAGVGRSKAVA